MEWRKAMLLRCVEDAGYLARVKELFFRDILFAFNGFFYTLDVRKKPIAARPFCTYPFQDDALLELVEIIKTSDGLHTTDLLWEKSRDMGATWMILGAFTWFWLNPEEPSDFLLGSRKEDYVDKLGDPRTHFHKIRYLLDRLPEWLLPKGFNRRKHDTFMKLQNPVTGGSITGESNNANFSTQGRYTAVLFDEFGKWEGTDTAAWTSAGDASPCRIANSTPFGAAGKHYELATDGKTRKIIMHWSLHPEKREGLACYWPKLEEAGNYVDEYNWVGLTSEWYEREKLRRTAQEIAQELDIDYIGAGSPIFDGRAGKRIGTLIRSAREGKAYLPDFFRSQLVGEPYPSDYVDYVWVYEQPRVDRNYIVSSDVAEGKEDGDFSIVKVLERESESVVATFASQVNEIDLAGVVNLVTKFYTFQGREEPWWAVEANGPGLATFDLLVDKYDLPNPFMMPIYDTARQAASFRKGWWTSTNSRRMLVAGIKEWLLNAQGWADPRCCREMTTFTRSATGKAEAKPGTHDDEVIAFGICLQVNKIAPLEDYKAPENPPAHLQDFITAVPQEVRQLNIEERCLASALRRQKFKYSDDYVGQTTEQTEHLQAYY